MILTRAGGLSVAISPSIVCKGVSRDMLDKRIKGGGGGDGGGGVGVVGEKVEG